MALKLLILTDIDHLGRSGDIVSVKPGYARNYLLPNKLAVVADSRTLKMQERLQEERKQQAIADKKDAENLAEQLNTIHLTKVVKVDHDGHMYGSVSALDIVHMLEAQTTIVVDKKFVLLKHAIKETGVHTIPLRLKEGVQATVTLKVLSEEAAAEAKATA